MEKLLIEYKVTRKKIKRLIESAKENLLKDFNEGQVEYIKSLGEIISDMNYSIEWMETGKRPGLRRGIERRAAFQREKAMNPLIMQKYFQSIETEYSWDLEVKKDGVTNSERMQIIDALSVLTEREKEIYLMSRGHCLSFQQIANYLNISKSTVQQNIKRADNKIGVIINKASSL